MVKITEEWDGILREEFSSESYLRLREFLKKEYSEREIFPSMYNIFNAMKSTPFKDVKVVLIGQDPYHERGQAMGLAFSVPKGVELPPSLINIFKEISAETGAPPILSGDLTPWAKQGVLLLNTVLTVRAHAANSHKGKGWEEFTDAAIKAVASQDRPIVYILWGSAARSKKAFITNPKHLVIESAHPSPLSAYRGF
ncbi:MAG: uracil-DNA glycosylase, partial [Clostridia bacterium]|nr:uracil-DNA glycosylase [Clostridia bacterium]